MHKKLSLALFALTTAILLTFHSSDLFAVDFESFEFNDPNFTELGSASNTANPGNNWSVDINNMTDSFVLNGNYDIYKFNDNFAANYLQIDNITSETSGSRFYVAEMAGWDFRGPDVSGSPSNPEQIRFLFLDEDTGTDGSTIVAQMQITRDTTTEGIQIEGRALGAGATSLSQTAQLNTVQTAPFTMVLELDKSDNTYEIFYKDGSNPSQSLARGFVSPDRNGNSLRFVANNNFGSEIDEVFSIDRIALTDTNPLTDLLTVEVNRDTGVVKLINTSGEALSGLESVTLTSSEGALDASVWKSIAGNYDNAGNGSVDSDDNWVIDSSSVYDLTESLVSGNGGDLSIDQEVILDTGSGLWIQNPNEDIVAELMFSGGIVRRPSVHFVGNNGVRFERGDLNFDGQITKADWTLFIAGSEADLSLLSDAESYQFGDLNGDQVNSFGDFDEFQATYDAANGIGSFIAMITAIPEPGTFVLLSMGYLGLIPSRTRCCKY